MFKSRDTSKGKGHREGQRLHWYKQPAGWLKGECSVSSFICLHLFHTSLFHGKGVVPSTKDGLQAITMSHTMSTCHAVSLL